MSLGRVQLGYKNAYTPPVSVMIVLTGENGGGLGRNEVPDASHSVAGHSHEPVIPAPWHWHMSSSPAPHRLRGESGSLVRGILNANIQFNFSMLIPV